MAHLWLLKSGWITVPINYFPRLLSVFEHNEGSYNTSRVSESNPTINDLTDLRFGKRALQTNRTLGERTSIVYKTIITMS